MSARLSFVTAIVCLLLNTNFAYAKVGPAILGPQDVTTLAMDFAIPTAIALDPSSGRVIVADAGSSLIRAIAQDGTTSTIAGGGATPDTTFDKPAGVAVAKDGTIFVADTGNDVIRKISQNVVTIVAGARGTSGSMDGPARDARFTRPRGMAFASDGTLYIADGTNYIRSLKDGVVTTLAHTPDIPHDVSNVAIWEHPGETPMVWYTTPDGVGRFNISAAKPDGFTRTVPGADGIVALGIDRFVASVPAKNRIYFSDLGSVRRLLSGNPSRFDDVGSFADGDVTAARFDNPGGLAMNASGHILVADCNNHRIRSLPLVDQRWRINDGQAFPQKVPGVYHIVLLSNSFAFHDAMWDDSVEGSAENYLNANASLTKTNQKIQIDAIRSGALGLEAQAEYINEFLGQGTVDLVIWSLNSNAFRNDKPDYFNYLFQLPDLSKDRQQTWRREITALNEQLGASHTKLLLMSHPFGMQDGPVESYVIKDETALYRTSDQETLRTPDYAYTFDRELEQFIGSIGIPYYPTFDSFHDYELASQRLPLFIPDDFHFSPYGNSFYSQLVVKALLKFKPWST